MPFLTAAGHRLEYAWHGPPPEEKPTLVFLHEGLGSVSHWRDFPGRAAAATGWGALAYSRWGYGQSDPVTPPRHVRYMHDEGLVTLPEVLTTLSIRQTVLVGHSDGASIALIYGGSGKAIVVAGMVLEAPHVFAEELSLQSIAAAAQTFRTDTLRERLAKHHADPDGAFWGWNGAWLNPEFRQWNLEEFLPGIRVPLLLVQGREDPYGTSRQLEAIQRGCSTPVSTLLLAGCGHAPHRDQPEMVLAAVTGFVRELERPKDP